MAKNERYVITTEINGQQAIDMLDKLTKKVERLEKAKKDALSLGHTSWIEGLDKKLKSATREMERFRQQTMSVNDILANLSSASLDQINKAMRSLRTQMKGLPSDSAEFKVLNGQLEQCKARLAEIKSEGKNAAEGFATFHDKAQFLYRVIHNLEHTSLDNLNRAAALLRENMAGLDPTSGPWKAENQHLVMIEGRIAAINAQQKQLASTIDRYDKEIQEANKSIEVTRRETELVNKTLTNISSANIRDLEYSIKILNERMRKIPRGTAEFREMELQVKKLRTELERTRYEGKAQQGWLSRMADGFNKVQGAFIILITMFTQLRFRIQQCIADFAQMEEEMANVRKYTGQTTEEVHEMNEEFKRIDTRTSRERLNQLAGDAGRLGIKGKQGIMDFVDAADKINVSLGDDLGENAVKNIGKLAQTFGEDKRMGLRGAMLATGSAVNELSQNSSAAAGYLVDFTARMAGVSNQANIAQTAIMGYAAVLDENMLRDETASTALTNFINKMFTDTEKFANMAGIKVKDFSDLLRTDANQAVITFLKAMKEKGGFAELAPLLNDMNLSGQRAVSVLTVLANRVDDVQERQKLANVEYQKATSILNEFNVQNNTVQARLDKRRKQFHDLSVELGERLLPMAEHTMSLASAFVRVLNESIKFVTQNLNAILLLSTAIGLLTIVYKAAEIRVYAWYIKELLLDRLHRAQAVLLKARTAAVLAYNVAVGLLTGNVTRAAAAMRLMRAAALSNPYTALLAVILALGTALYTAYSAWKKHNQAVHDNLQSVKELRAAYKAEHDILDQVAKSHVEEKVRVEQLSKVIRSNAYTVNERRNAVKAMQKLVPEYHATISNEGKLWEQNAKSIEEYIKKLNDAAMAEAIYLKKVEIGKKRVENELKKQRSQNNLKAVYAERQAHPERYQSNETVYMSGAKEERNQLLVLSKQQEDTHKARIAAAEADGKLIDAEERAVDRLMNSNQDIKKSVLGKLNDSTKNDPVVPDPDPPTFTPSGGSDKGDKKDPAEEMKKQLKEQEDLRKAATDAELADNMLRYRAGEQDYRQFLANQQRIQEQGLQRRMEVWRDHSEQYPLEYSRLEKRLAALQLNGDEELGHMREDELERNHQALLAHWEAEFNDVNSNLYQNQHEQNEILFQEDIMYLREKAALYREGSYERMQIEWEIDERIEQHKLDNQRSFQQMLRDVRMNYLEAGDNERMAAELANLEVLNNNKLLAEEDYQRAKLAIQAKYSKSQTPGEKTQATANDMLKVAGDQARNSLGSSADTFFVGTIQQYTTTMEKLKELYGNDQQNHEAYLQAKAQATAQFCQQMAQQLQVAYDSVNQILSSVSNLYSAQADYETAQVERKYEKQIAAAGKNQVRQKKLEEKKEKEIAAIKTKYNRKQVKMQIAQALVQTAIGALNAYSSVWAGAPWPANQVLAPIAAAIATAAGMLQVAAIKKQAAAQEAGYYEGGYTGGNKYHREAGVVHEGEFVANHHAVNNPAITPMLDLIDRAQRNNTVGSLTAADVTRQLGQGASVVAPVVNVTTDNADMQESADQLSSAAQELREKLSEPIPCYVVLDGPDGLMAQIKHLEKLKDI